MKYKQFFLKIGKISFVAYIILDWYSLDAKLETARNIKICYKFIFQDLIL